MKALVKVCLILICLSYGHQSCAQTPASISDCNALFKAKDLYKYAFSSHIEQDFLQTIDRKTWEEMSVDNKAGFSFAGIGATDDFDTMSKKRSTYFESTSYHRSSDEALNILLVVTSDRTYEAYSECLRALPNSGLIVWADKVTASQITLHVRFRNPPGSKNITLKNTLTGGMSSGQPYLWKGSLNPGINPEKSYVIQRAPGTSTTTVHIESSDGAAPFDEVYPRADAAIRLHYVSTVDVRRSQQQVFGQERTPNNDNRDDDDNCERKAGSDHGKCISQTFVPGKSSAQPATVSIPYHFENPDVRCNDFGCGWSSHKVYLSEDRRSLYGTINNSGLDVTAFLVADLIETMSESNCHSDGPLPVIYGQTVVFNVDNDCRNIARIEVKSAISGAVTDYSYGATLPDDATTSLERIDTAGHSTVATYKLQPGKADHVNRKIDQPKINFSLR